MAIHVRDKDPNLKKKGQKNPPKKAKVVARFELTTSC